MNIALGKFTITLQDKYIDYPMDYLKDELTKILEDEIGIPMKYIQKNCDDEYIDFVASSYLSKHPLRNPNDPEPETPAAKAQNEAPAVENIIEEIPEGLVTESVIEIVQGGINQNPEIAAVEEVMEIAEEPVTEAVEEISNEVTEITEEIKEEAPVVEEVKEEAPVAEEVKEEAPVAEEVKEEAPTAEEVKEETPVAEEKEAEISQNTDTSEMMIAEPELLSKKPAEKPQEISLDQFKNLTVSILLMGEEKRRNLFGTSDSVEIFKRNTAAQIADKFGIFTCNCGTDICYIEANIPKGEKFEIKCPKCGKIHVRTKKAKSSTPSVISIVGA